jgi:hypothetical protein
MAGLSDYMENIALNYIRGVAPATPPTGIYIGLFSSDPTDANTGGTEVTTTIRTAGRVAATFPAVTTGTMSNSAIVDFGNAAAGATVSHFAAFDAVSGGNKLFSGSLAAAKTLNANDPTSFAIGALTVTLD